jgi:hypothetical protein
MARNVSRNEQDKFPPAANVENVQLLSEDQYGQRYNYHKENQRGLLAVRPSMGAIRPLRACITRGYHTSPRYNPQFSFRQCQRQDADCLPSDGMKPKQEEHSHGDQAAVLRQL